MDEPDAVAEFTAHRGRLFGLAYRLLGSAMDAEDVLQDAYLRWSRADRGSVEVPGAWLARTVTNLCLTQLTSARARRERYVGPWLPEPVLTEDEALGGAQRRDSVSLALLVLLERLTPTERAVYVLREAFDYDHRSIAEILDCSPANSRQLYRRARARLAEQPAKRFVAGQAELTLLVDRFLAAARDGDLVTLEGLLAADVVSWSDGGGQVSAARHPVFGADRVARLFTGLVRKAGAGLTCTVREVNGGPAVVVHLGGQLLLVTVPELVDGRIRALRSIVNPAKLRFLARQLSHSGWLSGLPGEPSTPDREDATP